ncbi:hypothetical protein, partial [Candidatus Ichthyocystis hellenicum]|uniref:hypothetical protein n=1 Tax=Candidatus Ichthyocystis hellenicum TaxID=1561003 RepID=UPI001112BD5E
MYGASFCRNQGGIDQDNSDMPSVDVPSLTRVVTDPALAITACISSPSYQLAHNLCSDDYILNLEEVLEISVDCLQEYAINCGYKLTEDFLSIMSKHRTNFISKIDFILFDLSGISSLHGSFSFFLEYPEDHDVNVIQLMNKICSSFSRHVYRLIPDCISVLRSDIIPATIRSIFDSKVIDENCERKMSYPEMEKLFLYFVSILEKSIMVKAMEYWRNFCDKVKLLLLIPSVDYSNPFIWAYNFDGVRALEVDCPSAFTNEFGEYISFIAVYKIREIIKDFVDKCSHKFKEIVYSKCSYICDRVDGAYEGLEEFRCGFNVLMNKEFDKMIAEEVIEDKISSFSKNMVVWNNHRGIEINKVLIFDNIIGYARTLLEDVVAVDICRIIKSFYKRLELYKIRSASLLGKISLAAGDVGSIKIHPYDDKIISLIVRKFSIQIKEHLGKLFRSMLKSRTVLPSGVVLRDSSWTVISSELSKIATESVEFITKKQYEELDIALSKSRVVDVKGSGSSSCIIRKVTDYEKKYLMICAKKIIDNRMKSHIRLSWVRMVNKSSTDIGYGYKEKSKDVSGSGREGKWGVKLRYSDNISILSVRRKFSCRIKDVVLDKFSSMVRGRYKFDDGTFIGLFAWFRLSKKLFPIAREEVNSILKEELEELEGVVSRALTVVDSGVDRELTDEERSIVLKNIMRLVGVALKKL